MHSAYLQYQTDSMDLDQQILGLEKRIDDNVVYSKMKEPLIRAAECDVQIPPHFGKTMEFVEHEVRAHRSLRIVLFASIIGGVIGALLTNYLKLFQ